MGERAGVNLPQDVDLTLCSRDLRLVFTNHQEKECRCDH